MNICIEPWVEVLCYVIGKWSCAVIAEHGTDGLSMTAPLDSRWSIPHTAHVVTRIGHLEDQESCNEYREEHDERSKLTELESLVGDRWYRRGVVDGCEADTSATVVVRCRGRWRRVLDKRHVENDLLGLCSDLCERDDPVLNKHLSSTLQRTIQSTSQKLLPSASRKKGQKDISVGKQNAIESCNMYAAMRFGARQIQEPWSNTHLFPYQKSRAPLHNHKS